MKKNNKKGFTLVELVIVVAVMAILVAVAIPTVKSVTSSAQGAVNETNARTIESTIKLWEANVAAGTVGAPSTLQAAMTEAALGIEDATYAYNQSTGVAKYVGDASATVSAVAGAKQWKISFATTGIPTVSEIAAGS